MPDVVETAGRENSPQGLMEVLCSWSPAQDAGFFVLGGNRREDVFGPAELAERDLEGRPRDFPRLHENQLVFMGKNHGAFPR